jgi:DNA-binding response OmpR family regulator
MQPASLSPIHLLLVEDDESIAEPLRFGLENEGFQVSHAATGPQGLDLARALKPDLILLDVMLPGMDGYAVVRTLRAESAVPVLMLTARGQELDRVMGLELGADDYLVKPFSFRELVARVRAMLRRRQLDRKNGGVQDRLTSGDLMLDRTARSVNRGSRPVELTAREFDLLTALMERAGQAQARQELLDRVWGDDWVGDPRTLDVHIRWLREKIEDDPSAPQYIETVRGFGYRFVKRDA